MAKNEINAYDEQLYAQRQAEIMAAQQAQQQGQSGGYANAMFAPPNKQNIVEWELDFSNELVNIERLLKSDILARDSNGNEMWIENPDKSCIFLNKKGVDDVLRQIILLVNKNKVLSNYNVEEIKMRLRIIGHELRSFIYNNYVEYEIDNDYKMNNFSPIVLAILDVIEAAYRRALNGETHKGLSEARFVQQNEPIMSNPNQNFNFYPQQQKKGLFSKLNPFSWGR
jgi:hypothetical protein